MRLKGFKYAAVILLSVGATACGVTKHLPEDSYMLTRSKVKPDREAPRDERIPARELERYIPQSPSRKLFGTNFPAWLYLQADPGSDSGWDNFLRKAGSEPVILDTALTELGTRNLKGYMNKRGFRESESDYHIKYNDRKRRAHVTYTVDQGRPYRIRNVSYDFRDSFVEQVIHEDSTTTLLVPGNIFDEYVLASERERIVRNLNNRGYYNFNVNNIVFRVDTTAGDHLYDVKMEVRQRLAGYDDRGDAIWENNAIYSIKDIYVRPDYDATAEASDSMYWHNLDTVNYRGLKIMTSGKSRIRPSTLRRAINIYPDYLYSYDEVQRVYNGIMRLNYFKSARILFDEVAGADSGEGLVTYVGGGESDTTGLSAETAQRQLNCTILCSPAMRQGYTVDFEATTTSAFYGLKASASYMNRNLFRGAEVFNVGLSGGYEFYRGTEENRSNSFEFGGYASVAFPRFVTPFRVDRANRLYRPLTRLELSANLQNRPYYHRTITGGNITYSWSNGRRSNYTFRPVDLNIVNVSYIDEVFLENILNPYLKNSYKSQFIPAISGSYQYGNAMRNETGNSLALKLNVELAGNLTHLLASAFSEKVTRPIDPSDPASPTETLYEIFGIPFAQYFRFEGSISNSIALGANTSLVYRFMGGIGLAYGNASSMPLDRQFYAGGSNSMRGWVVRTLGPGGQPRSEWPGYATGRYFPSQTSNLKLEANLELRFPLWNSLRGALFFDVGNIWHANIKGSDQRDPAVFRFDTFLPQLGFNTGVGIRYDLGVAVIRLDWGIRLHDPNEPAGKRWVQGFHFSNTALNFGIGYPF